MSLPLSAPPVHRSKPAQPTDSAVARRQLGATTEPAARPLCQLHHVTDDCPPLPKIGAAYLARLDADPHTLRVASSPGDCAFVERAVEFDGFEKCHRTPSHAWIGAHGTLIPWCAAHFEIPPRETKYKLVRLDIARREVA